MRKVMWGPAIALLLAACRVVGASPATSDPWEAEASVGSVRPVSLSAPFEDSAAAMAQCGVHEFRDQVVGAGQVLHAKDLPRYVRLSGQEPEIQTDAAAWVVQYEGIIRLPLRGTRYPYVDQVDPTCVVVNGESFWFTTGEIRNPDGTVVVPSLPPAPAETLPPLGS
jgi:hypothetical protein